MAYKKREIDMRETADIPKAERKRAKRYNKITDPTEKQIADREKARQAMAKLRAKRKSRKPTQKEVEAKKKAIAKKLIEKETKAVLAGKKEQALTFSDGIPKDIHLSPEELIAKQAESAILNKFSNRLWRLNNLYYIMDEEGNKVLFKMNPVQQKIYDKLWHKNVILKSRQHGVTTFFCILFLDEALFKSNIRAGIIADTVPHAERFFEDKIKYAYDHLLPEIREAITYKTNNVREIKFSNNSMIYVSDQMKSGTLQALHISEFGAISKAHPSRAKAIVSDAFPTVHKKGIITIESTAEGNEGAFYDICKRSMDKQYLGNSLTSEDFKFMFYGWYEDKRNYLDEVVPIPVRLQDYFSKLEAMGINLTNEQKYWYVKKEENLGDLVFKQYPSYADEAFNESVEGAYYQKQMVKVREQNRICTVPYYDAYNVDTYWDLGVGNDDYTAIWFTQKVGGELRFIDYYENTGEGLAHYVNVLNMKNYKYGYHVAPHDARHKLMGEQAETRIQIAARLGLNFTVCDSVSVADGIESVRSMLSIAWFDETKCERGIQCIDKYRKKWDAKNGQWLSEPLHNEFSHGADAIRYCAVMWKKLNTYNNIERRFNTTSIPFSAWT